MGIAVTAQQQPLHSDPAAIQRALTVRLISALGLGGSRATLRKVPFAEVQLIMTLLKGCGRIHEAILSRAAMRNALMTLSLGIRPVRLLEPPSPRALAA